MSVTAGSAAGQVANKPGLTLEGATKVIAAAAAEAKRVNVPGGVIAVVDDGGNLMALERIDGTFAAGASISIGKARTAVLFKKPTRPAPTGSPSLPTRGTSTSPTGTSSERC